MGNSNFYTIQQIDIVFSIDDIYVNHVLVTMHSIIKNNKSFKKIHFHIITNDISYNNQNMIKTMEKSNPEVCVDFIFIDIRRFMDFPINIKHITSITYGRFLAADILDDLDRVLYLDADVIVLGDLSELWNAKIQNKCIAGSHKQYINKQFPGYKESIGLERNNTYINTGVMLMNLSRIRQLNKTQELLINAKKLKDIVRIQDQDIINITFNGEITRVHKKYNYTDSDRREGSLGEDEIVIVHFNTRNKPWSNDFMSDDTNKTFAKKYLEYQHEIITAKV